MFRPLPGSRHFKLLKRCHFVSDERGGEDGVSVGTSWASIPYLVAHISWPCCTVCIRGPYCRFAGGLDRLATHGNTVLTTIPRAQVAAVSAEVIVLSDSDSDEGGGEGDCACEGPAAVPSAAAVGPSVLSADRYVLHSPVAAQNNAESWHWHWNSF